MALYKFKKNQITGQVETVIKDWDKTSCLHIKLGIEANTDYQEYLKWVEEGNTADPAD